MYAYINTCSCGDKNCKAPMLTNSSPYQPMSVAYETHTNNTCIHDRERINKLREKERINKLRERERINKLREKEFQRYQTLAAQSDQELEKAKNHAVTVEMENEQLRDQLRTPESLQTEELKTCKLCLDREINATFSCGHTACYECALQTLDSIGCCAFCRKKDVQIIKLYLG